MSYRWDSLHARAQFCFFSFLFSHSKCIYFSGELASRFILTSILWSIHLERDQSDKCMKRWWLLQFCTENRIDFLAQASHRELSWHRRATVVRRNDAPEIPRHDCCYYCRHSCDLCIGIWVCVELEIHNLLKFLLFCFNFAKQFYCCFFFNCAVAAFARTRMPYLIASRFFLIVLSAIASFIGGY